MCCFLFSVVEFAGELIKSTGECDRLPKKWCCSYPGQTSHLLMMSTCDCIKSNLNIGTSFVCVGSVLKWFSRGAMRQAGEGERESC